MKLSTNGWRGIDVSTVDFGGWVVCWRSVVLFGSSFYYVLGVVFYIQVKGVGVYLGGSYIFGI